jgi:hypothetical protein
MALLREGNDFAVSPQAIETTPPRREGIVSVGAPDGLMHWVLTGKLNPFLKPSTLGQS